MSARPQQTAPDEVSIDTFKTITLMIFKNLLNFSVKIMFKHLIKISLLNSKFLFSILNFESFPIFLVVFNMTELLLISISLNCSKLMFPLHLKILSIKMIGGLFVNHMVSP